MVRKSLKAIKATKPKLDRAKIAATSERDIRRHMREDGEAPARGPRIEDVITPQVIRKRLDMTQEEFAVRSLLVVVARNPKAALAALAADAA